MTGANFTDRIGFHHLLWMPQPDAPDAVGSVTNMVIGLGGPVLGLGLKTAKATDAFNDGNLYRALEILLPKGVSDILKAGRLTEGSRGVQDRSGATLLGPEDASWGDVAWQGVGFAPQSSTLVYENKGLQQGRTAELYAQRDRLVRRYLNARTAAERSRIYREEVVPYRRTVRGDATLDLTYPALRRALNEQRLDSRKHRRGVFTPTRAGQAAGSR
jgi:hypothetical protein